MFAGMPGPYLKRAETPLLSTRHHHGHGDIQTGDGVTSNQIRIVTRDIDHAHHAHAVVKPLGKKSRDHNTVGILLHIFSDAINSVAVSKCQLYADCDKNTPSLFV